MAAAGSRQRPTWRPRPARCSQLAELPERDHDGRETGRTIRLAYREWGHDLPPGAPTLLLLQGSPGSGRDFDGIAPGLAARGYRAIAPDLPGFGASSHAIADYSIRTHALYCRDLLDEA